MKSSPSYHTTIVLAANWTSNPRSIFRGTTLGMHSNSLPSAAHVSASSLTVSHPCSTVSARLLQLHPLYWACLCSISLLQKFSLVLLFMFASTIYSWYQDVMLLCLLYVWLNVFLGYHTSALVAVAAYAAREHTPAPAGVR